MIDQGRPAGALDEQLDGVGVGRSLGVGDPEFDVDGPRGEAGGVERGRRLRRIGEARPAAVVAPRERVRRGAEAGDADEARRSTGEHRRGGAGVGEHRGTGPRRARGGDRRPLRRLVDFAAGRVQSVQRRDLDGGTVLPERGNEQRAGAQQRDRDDGGAPPVETQHVLDPFIHGQPQ
jgi:hypothetical protein